MTAVAAATPAGAAHGAVRPRENELVRAARQFEAILTRLLVREMRDAQLKSGFFGGGTGASVYEGLFEQHLADAVSNGSPFGIADALLRQWERDPASAGNVVRTVDGLQAREAYEKILETAGSGSVSPQVPPGAADKTGGRTGEDTRDGN